MSQKTLTEVDIWSGVVAPEGGNMRPDDARAVLHWKFSEAANRRMRQLADLNNRGELSKAELAELEDYIHVGQVLALLQAKARLSLKQPMGSNGEG